MFPYLLFRGFTHPADLPDDQTAPERWNKGERAFALWDSTNSSNAQMKLLLAVAPLALSGPEDARGLEQLKTVAEKTGTTRGYRNAIAHSGFDRTFRFQPAFPADAVNAFAGSFYEEISLTDAAHPKLKGKDPLQEIPAIIEIFRDHRREVQNVHSWLRIGLPKDAGAT